MHCTHFKGERHALRFPVPRKPHGVRLARRKTLVLDDARTGVISVDYGCVWITLQNDPRDIVLLPGMRFEIDRDGRTVITAEEDSRLRISRPATWGERALAALASLRAQILRTPRAGECSVARVACAASSTRRAAATRRQRAVLLGPAAAASGAAGPRYRFTKVIAPCFSAICTVSPAMNLPARISFASGFSISCWMARLSGRAP